MYNNTSFFPDHGWRLPKCWGGHIPTNRWYACQRIATWKTRRNWQHVYISCCPRQGCHFTKLDESLQCLRCNTKASPLAHGIPIVYGITAIRSITNCHTQQSVQIIFVVIITWPSEKLHKKKKTLDITVIRASDSFKWVKFMQNFEHGVSFQPIKNNISVYLFAVVNNCWSTTLNIYMTD